MNKPQLLQHLERLDARLKSPTRLCIYGSAAFMLLGEPERTSLDIDVAGPYSQADFGQFSRAAAAAGLPVNPPADTGADHFEWVGPLRLCLPKPTPGSELPLWQGRRLAVVTVPPAALVASKLIRYDAADQGDIQYLLTQHPVAFSAIRAAAGQLPPPFNDDPLVRDNLASLRTDLKTWRRGSA